MPTNWVPNITAPKWCPPELEAVSASYSDIKSFLQEMRRYGFTSDSPTLVERVKYFRDARCDHGHTVVGRMVVSPSGVRYPFAVCTDSAHRDFLVLWEPYYCGWDSGREDS